MVSQINSLKQVSGKKISNSQKTTFCNHFVRLGSSWYLDFRLEDFSSMSLMRPNTKSSIKYKWSLTYEDLTYNFCFMMIQEDHAFSGAQAQNFYLFQASNVRPSAVLLWCWEAAAATVLVSHVTTKRNNCGLQWTTDKWRTTSVGNSMGRFTQ